MISGKPSGREFTTTNKIQYTHVYPTIIIEKDLEKPWFHNDNNPQIVDFPHQTISLPRVPPGSDYQFAIEHADLYLTEFNMVL